MQSEETHRKILFTFGGQKNEIGGACGTYGGQDFSCPRYVPRAPPSIQGFGWKTRGKETNSKT